MNPCPGGTLTHTLYSFSRGLWQRSLRAWFWVHPEHGNEVSTISVLEVELSHLDVFFLPGVLRGAQGPVLGQDWPFQVVSYRHCSRDSLLFKTKKPKPEPVIQSEAGLDTQRGKTLIS